MNGGGERAVRGTEFSAVFARFFQERFSWERPRRYRKMSGEVAREFLEAFCAENFALYRAFSFLIKQCIRAFSVSTVWDSEFYNT